MLWVVATPIGNEKELSFRSKEILERAEIIICESTKETSKLLKHFGISGKTYEVLNEHSKPEELKDLVSKCRDHEVALVSDCGTPAFCDPGANLVHACRKEGIIVKPSLGPSSLMGLLSMAGQRIDEFLFRGFIPAETQAREKAYGQLKAEKRAIILMDTPYRFRKMLQEISVHFPKRKIFVSLNISQDSEEYLEGSAAKIIEQCKIDKAEFMLLISAESESKIN